MTVPRSSRQLSERVEIDFQRRPNAFRRRVWVAALGLALGSLGFLAWASLSGQQQIYDGGPLATPHRMIENDCAKCHTTWAPVERVLALDVKGTEVSSVTNAACTTCHPGATHHDNQVPQHATISCAYCHIEHIGDHDLKRVADRVCTGCHADLKTGAGKSSTFASAVTSFERADGHPEFALQRLIASGAEKIDGLGTAHKALSVVGFEAGKGWRDKAALQFNHSAHLTVSTSNGTTEHRVKGGERVTDKALARRFGPFYDAAGTCAACHESDAAGSHMKPISFEQHCRACHPLLFDNDRFPKQEVPHGLGLPAVRGYLTDRYTLSILGQAGDGNGSNAASSTASNGITKDAPPRSVPGRKPRLELSAAAATAVEQQVAQAERTALRHSHLFFGAEAKGGCRYCHTVHNPDQPSAWSIQPPDIPERWMPHARFSHQAHELMNCNECHEGATRSRDTGDVLMPKIDLCRKCHSSEPAQATAALAPRLTGARSDCVECHGYHDHSKDAFIGGLNPVLEPSKPAPLSSILPRDSK